MSCSKLENRDCEILDQDTPELPNNLYSDQNNANDNKSSSEEVPELLHITQNKNNINETLPFNKTSSFKKFELNSKLIHLLKSIQDEDYDNSNINYDREQLKQLLNILEDSEHELSDKNLMEFVNFVNIHNSEDLELDLSRLKEVLLNFKRGQNPAENHRTVDSKSEDSSLEDIPLRFDILDHPDNNEKIEHDLEVLAKKYNLPKNYGLEGSHLGLGHFKGHHIGMGLQQNLISKLGKHDGKHHYHVGDSQKIGAEVGHLEQGPHHSLSFVPDTVKLHLDPENVKPNHEGVVISYENEPKN